MKDLVIWVIVIGSLLIFCILESKKKSLSSESNIPVPVKMTGVPEYVVQNGIVYVPIKISWLPRIVKSSAMGKYAAYVIEKAFRGNDETYKLVLKKENVKRTVFYKETGEIVKQGPVEIGRLVVWN